MPPRRANTRNSNARNANPTLSALDQKVCNAKFRNAIQMMAQTMTNQNNPVQAHMNENC